jgi:hypothetical protein
LAVAVADRDSAHAIRNMVRTCINSPSNLQHLFGQQEMPNQ